MNRIDWLNTATRKIRFGPDRKAVQRELEAHLEDLREASGLEEGAALQAMGDPIEIAEELGRVHRPWLGYLWRASQIALAGAAAVYILLMVLLVTGRWWLLPGVQLYDYLTWEEWEVEDILEEREIPCAAQIETGGYTIRASRAVLRKTSETSPEWALYLPLDITLGRWEEALFGWHALTGVRSSAGEAEDYGTLVNYAVWGFWQKSEFIVNGLSEDTEWLELDFGHGALRRTMHIDLTEEAAA